MTRALVTFAVGAEHERLLDIALPSFRAFAAEHRYDVLTAVPQTPEDQRPSSWLKIPALIDALHDHDAALWVDADTVIVDPADDIVATPGVWQAMVEHHTPDGHVPNLGVWLVRRPMLPVLERLWTMTHYLNHGWWEQAAMLELLGYTQTRPVRLGTPTRLFDRTAFLDAGWNVHPWDENRSDRDRIRHATMHPDRAASMTAWADARLVPTLT